MNDIEKRAAEILAEDEKENSISYGALAAKAYNSAHAGKHDKAGEYRQKMECIMQARREAEEQTNE